MTVTRSFFMFAAGAMSVTICSFMMGCWENPLEPPKHTPRDRTPAVSSDGSQIVYYSYATDSVAAGLYMIDSCGAPLGFSAPIGTFPEWGAGDSLLIYSSGTGLRVRNLNSGTTDDISEEARDSRADFHPERQEILFDRYNDGDSDLYTHSFLTGNTELLLHRGIEPAWSPEGDRVVFKYFTGVRETLRSRVFILDLSTGAVDTLPDFGGSLHFPLFSADGKSLFFERQLPDEGYAGLARYDLSEGTLETVVSMGRDPDISWRVNTLYYTAPDHQDVERIWRLNLQTGEKKQFTR